MRYLSPEVEHPDESGYDIVDGVIVDIDARPNARKAYDEWTRYWAPSATEKKAEELAWAARSGPCVTIRKPNNRKKAS